MDKWYSELRAEALLQLHSTPNIGFEDDSADVEDSSYEVYYGVSALDRTSLPLGAVRSSLANALLKNAGRVGVHALAGSKNAIKTGFSFPNVVGAALQPLAAQAPTDIRSKILPLLRV